MRLSYLFFLLVAISSESLYAQQHFTDCVCRTGHNATLIVPVAATLQVDGAPMAAGDEIAAFTPDGRCTGVAVWNGRSVALTLWGRGAFTSGGLTPGDSLHVRIWDASARMEYHEGNSRLQVSLKTDEPYLHARLRYVPGAIYLVEEISAMLTYRTQR